MKRSVLAAYIRQLCHLGLHPKVIIPPVIEALSRWIGADAGEFWFTDENHRAYDVYSQSERLLDVLPQCLAEMHDNAEVRRALGIDWCATARSSECACGTIDFDSSMEQTRWLEVLEPARIGHRLVIAAKDNDRSWGMAVLNRSRDSRGFSAKEVNLGASMARYLADAVRTRSMAANEFTPGDEFGIIVADQDGRILFQNTIAKRLLYFAAPTSTLITRFGDVKLPAWLTPLTDRLRRVSETHHVSSPVLQRQNEWGRVMCRAHFLEARAGSSPELIGIHLQRHEATVLRIARAAFNAGLSNGQRELCVHLANDKRYVEIAAIMGITEHTVIDYTRKIYQRLNVCSRRELLRKLMHSAMRAEECPV